MAIIAGGGVAENPTFDYHPSAREGNSVSRRRGRALLQRLGRDFSIRERPAVHQRADLLQPEPAHQDQACH